MRHLDPGDIEEQHLKEWAKGAMVNETALSGVRKVIESWSPDALSAPLTSDALLSSRLLKKAARGTVRETVKAKTVS